MTQLVAGEVLRMDATGAKGLVVRELEEKRSREGVMMQRALIRIFFARGCHKIGDMLIWKQPLGSDER